MGAAALPCCQSLCRQRKQIARRLLQQSSFQPDEFPPQIALAFIPGAGEQVPFAGTWEETERQGLLAGTAWQGREGPRRGPDQVRACAWSL